MMNAVVTVNVCCDVCEKRVALNDVNADKTSTLDAVAWRAVRDLILTTGWHRVQFPDASTFRDFHVCSQQCAEALVTLQYRASKGNVE